MRIYLQKNEKNIAKNKENGNEKLPYFTLKRIPEEGEPKETEWVELGALWKGAKGYSGKVTEGVEIIIKKKELSEEDKKAIVALRGEIKDPSWD